ncbi:MAG: gluconate 2-dehydrogenase subunit 3 family protein [Pseudomonadota bacterium]
MKNRRKAAFTRRAALRVGSVGLITVTVAGCQQEMTPADAKSAGAAYQTLSDTEALTLEALGETLVPGAKAAGIAPYVDAGLTAASADSLLMIRYLDVPAPWTGFYKTGLAALETFAKGQTRTNFADLDAETQAALVRTISGSQPDGWSDAGAPPAPFFYFALRGDAIDVTWGTRKGFETFDQPYLAHIEPPDTPW